MLELAGGLRAENVDLRAEVAEGLFIAKICEDISTLTYRGDNMGDYDFVGDPVPPSCKSDCNVFAPVRIIAVR